MPVAVQQDAESLVQETLVRLRAAQVSFASEPAEARRAQMADMLAEAIKRVVPAHRAAFLRILRSRLPEVRRISEPPPDLLGTIAALDEDARHRLISEMREAGLLPADSPSSAPAAAAAPAADAAAGAASPLPADVSKAFEFVMRKRGIENLDPVRAMKLLVYLTELASVGDQVIWSAWKTIAPQSAIRRQVDLRKDMSRYLAGDTRVTSNGIKASVERLQRMLSSLIAGMGRTAQHLSHSYLAPLHPQEIEAHAAKEGGGLLGGSREAKCWKEYIERSVLLNEDNVAHAVKEAIGTGAESLMNAAGGAP